MNFAPWKTRLLVVVSGLWLFFAAAMAGSSYSYSWWTFFVLGFGPVFFIWGTLWIADGFLETYPDFPEKMRAALLAPKAPTPAAVPSNSSKPWRRFFARTLDLAIFIPVFAFCIGYVLPAYAALNAYLINAIAMVPAFGLLALLTSAFGTTPGKYLLGLNVINETGGPISLKTALKREFWIFALGYGAGIPFVPLITFTIAYKALMRDEQTSWDRILFTRIEYGEIGRFRSVAAVVLTIVIVVLLRVADRQYALQYAAAHEPVVWQNPVSEKIVTLPLGWKPATQKSEGNFVVSAFQNGDTAYSRLMKEAIDPALGLSSESYAKLFLDTKTKDLGSDYAVTSLREDKVGNGSVFAFDAKKVGEERWVLKFYIWKDSSKGLYWSSMMTIPAADVPAMPEVLLSSLIDSTN